MNRFRSLTSPINLGLYLDRSPLHVPDGGMTDCHNVRIKNGKVRNDLLGWKNFLNLSNTQNTWPDHEVILIDTFKLSNGTEKLILGTRKDLYQYISATAPKWNYLTPLFSTGTADVTLLDETVYFPSGGLTAAGVKAGDWIYVGTANNRYKDTESLWFLVDSVTDDNNLEMTTPWVNTTSTGNAFTIRLCFTGDPQEIWQADMFPDAAGVEDLWIACNGHGNQIVKWNGTDAEVTQIEGSADLNFTCETVRYYKNMMLYGNIEDSGGLVKPNAVRNSAIGDPETVVGAEAAEWLMADGADELRAMLPLGDVVVGYCDDSINVAQFVGYPVQFARRTAIPNIGLLSSRLLVDYGDYHEFVSNDRGYRFDGVNVTEFGSHVMRELLRTLDPSRVERALAHRDPENGEVQWVFPIVTDGTGDDGIPLHAYTQHYLEPRKSGTPVPFTRRDLPAGAMGSFVDSGSRRFSDLDEGFDAYDFKWNDRAFSTAFPVTLFGNSTGRVYQLNTVSTITGGLDMESYARFSRRPVLDGRRKGIIARIEPHAERKPDASYGLGVILWTADDPEGELTKAAQLDYDLDQAGRRAVAPRKMGLYREIEFATTGRSRSFAISGFGIETSAGGIR